MKKFARIAKNNFFMIRYVFKYIPFYVLASLLLTITSSISAILGDVLLTKYVIDCVQYNRKFSDVLYFIAVGAVVLIVNSLIKSWFTYYYAPIAKEKLSKKMQGELFEKAKKINLLYYDSPDYYNSFILSTQNADERAIQVFSNFMSLLGAVITICEIAFVMVVIDASVILFVILSLVLSMLTNLKKNEKVYELDIQLKAFNRRKEYVNRVFYFADYAKELRMSNAKSKLFSDYKKTNERANEEIRKKSVGLFALDILDGFCFRTCVVDVIYFAILVYKAAVSKAISYGSVAALINAAWNMSAQLQYCVSIIPNLAIDSMYIEDYRNFLLLESDRDNIKGHMLKGGISEINLEDCSFSYPNSNKIDINDVCLSIENKQKIAIVGYNGAGKTTLIKIILGLYKPSLGQVKVNGIDLEELDKSSFYKEVGCVFQDFKLFATTIGNNVMMDIMSEDDKERVVMALERANVTNSLDSSLLQLDKMLTKEFSDDGLLLSGGQLQMLALSRVFAYDNSFIVLDEPSSALDPVMETEINNKLMDMAKDKAVIFISHRLSTTKKADIIYMMENGQFIEKGTHDELMKLDGKYAEMFKVQSEKYKRSLLECYEL